MTLMQDVRATIPGLRDAMPELRVTMPDLREVTAGLRDVVPEARAAVPAIREGVAELRGELPGPWHKERPSLVGRAAIVVVAVMAVTVVAWGVMALLERRRLKAAQARVIEDDRYALARAEDEGMGTTIAAPAMSYSTTVSEPMTFPGAEPSNGSAVSGKVLSAIAPKADASAGRVEGSGPDGR